MMILLQKWVWTQKGGELLGHHFDPNAIAAAIVALGLLWFFNRIYPLGEAPKKDEDGST